jgi:OHS family lactose permease-like MFS transporter
MIESNKKYYISCSSLLAGDAAPPYLSLWLTETIGINHTNVGLENAD